MSLSVSNCPRCGKLFAKGLHDICPSCVKEIDLQYEKCLKYLREHRKCTLQELSEATEVSVKQITKFIREGRISIDNNPNMSYACELCGASITTGKMCDNCRSGLLKDANHLKEDQARGQAQQSQEEKIGFNIKDRLQDRR
ncbi:TIGR03826 family flagellar region protein [Paenibacillus chartarius]|uniref:TIGR03826 family flagellar region protein n=1 Tax=Paenibacillus chartarius TaxID=747481 RepID=A0ABV6DJY0_9BACL